MADNESDTLETLFSFEVVVEYVRIQTGAVKRNLEPAVGVRLLDFPTLMIYQGEQRDCKQQEDSDSEKENATIQNVTDQPLNRTVEYNFRKGKSCLLKINLDVLHTHLSNVPLYVMILDSSSEIPKFLGSSMISLAKAIDRIKSDVKHFGIYTPSAQGEKGLYSTCNLMGVKIGCISLGYKIISLGKSLIPHIPESRVLQMGPRKVTNKQPSDEPFENRRCKGKDVLRMPSHQPDTSDVLCQNIELEGQQTDSVVSEGEAKCSNRISAGTQTELTRRKVKSIEVEPVDFDGERNHSIFCPPPLYYSCPEKLQEQGDADRYRIGNIEMEALRVEDLHSEEQGQEEDQVLRARALSWSMSHPEEVHQRSRAVQQTQEAPAILGEALRGLPLLSALLAELSQLNIQSQQLPVSAPTDPTLLYQPASEYLHTISPQARPRLQPPSPNASLTPRGRRSPSPSPQLKQSKLQVNSVGSLSTSPKECSKAKRQRLRREASKSPPKRKLWYGLTNTVRLRLLQTNPAVLREHERKESLRKSQSELLKKATRRPHQLTTTKTGHKHTKSHGVNLDGNVQTLVNSVDIDSAQTETYPAQTLTEHRSCTLSGKNGNQNNGTFPLNPSSDNFSKTTTKTIRMPIQNQIVQVHIPSALSHYSDHSEGGGTPSDSSDPRPVLASSGLRSTNAEEYRGSVRECRSSEMSHFSSLIQHHSDSYRGTPDLTEYVDDFTSLEPTEGFSPDLPSSPELALGSISQQASGSDSPTQGSQRPALPIPVKAGASPQRSLKGTHIIRPRTQASALSLSSGNSECASAMVSSVQSGHQRSGAVSVATREHSVCEEARGSGSQLSECFQHSLSVRESSVELHLPSNDSEPEAIPSPPPEKDREMRDELGSLGFSNKYHHISELVLNKLPGYTL